LTLQNPSTSVLGSMWKSTLALASCFAFATQAPAAVVYRPGEGWTEEAEDSGQIEGTAAAQLKKAEELEAAGDIRPAIGAYRGLVKKFPNSASAARAQYKTGELLEKEGDYDRAFNAFGDYLKKYPRGEEFDKAVESQFNIARLFLEGERKKLFGVKTLPSMGRAQEMFESIIKNAPFSKLAPLAQFNIGQALEKQGKDVEAVAAYQVVVSKFPNESVAADAQYQIGYVHLRQSRAAYDRAAANRAREAFEDFLARYPNSEKAAQARDNLKALQGRETKGAYEIGKFYDKQKNYKAAVIYYNETIKQEAGSPQAELAKQRVDELKTLVGEDALRAGPEKVETGQRATVRRKLQAQVDTASRPDYLGPPVVVPDETAQSNKPKLRTTTEDIGPVPAVEPALPQQ
jgi:outer membrane protein assembly factor BamD